MDGIRLFFGTYFPNDVRFDEHTGSCRFMHDMDDICRNMLSNLDLEDYEIHVEIKKVPIDD